LQPLIVSMPEDEYPHYIEFRHVYKTFDRPVLEDVNFWVDAGQTLAIIGRSGVGKSVSLGHIMGFMKPDDGQVIVAYQDITRMTEQELRQLVREAIARHSGREVAEAPGSDPAAVHSSHARFPLRSGEMAQLQLPARLQREDADRLSAFLRTLQVETQKEIPERTGEEAQAA